MSSLAATLVCLSMLAGTLDGVGSHGVMCCIRSEEGRIHPPNAFVHKVILRQVPRLIRKESACSQAGALAVGEGAQWPQVQPKRYLCVLIESEDRMHTHTHMHTGTLTLFVGVGRLVSPCIRRLHRRTA